MAASWQWFAYLRDHAFQGKDLLLLNLDETSVKFCYPPQQGLKVKRLGGTTGGRDRCMRHATRGQQRKAFTYVAIVANDAAVQPHLPQIFIMASNYYTRAEHDRIEEKLPSNVSLWRRRSGWINNEVFAEILKFLGTRMAPHLNGRVPVLLMDAHKVHFSIPVLSAASRAGIRILILPASCTSLLQPLDTDIFARFKLFFRHRLQAQMTVGRNQNLSPELIVQETCSAIKHVIEGISWGEVFAKNGFGATPSCRRSLLEKLQWESFPVLPPSLPSLDGFKNIFPNGAVIPFDHLLKPLLPEFRSGRGIRRAREPFAGALEDSVPEVWSHARLRPRRSTSLSLLPEPLPEPCLPAASSSGPCPASPTTSLPPAPTTSSSHHVLPPLPRAARLMLPPEWHRHRSVPGSPRRSS